MSLIRRYSKLWDDIRDLMERSRAQEGYRPPLVNLAPDDDIEHLTAGQLIRYKPALATLLHEFDQVTDNENLAPQLVWFADRSGGFRYCLRGLGVWEAETKDPFLRTRATYEVAYNAFMEVMDP